MSDNYAAVSQLVTEGRNLLNAIKGGAIQTMESTFADLVASMNSAIEQVDTDSIRAEFGFVAQNYNHDFYDTCTLEPNRHGVTNVFPIGFGIGSGRNDSIKAEMIYVGSGDPALRDPLADELLDFMGVRSGLQSLSLNFRILKLTILDADIIGLDGCDFTLPDRHVKSWPAASFMIYTKVEGTTTIASVDAGGAPGWKQRVKHYGGSPSGYELVDLHLENTSVGDVIYLALPTICVGHWPSSKKHGELYNLKNDTYRKINELKV